MSIVQEKWDEILETVKIEHELTDISFKTWLKPLEIFSVSEEDHLVTILVPSEQMGVSYIEKKYMFPIKVAITEITGIEYELSFVLPNQIRQIQTQENPQGSDVHEAIRRAHLNPAYTFDTFVVGSNNKFAQACALAVAESPGKMYNPLFIYGGAGLGKTHLMHSIGNFIIRQDPSMNVLYVTSETFTNELIEAIRNKNNSMISSFRDKYRSVDVLLIDDIQFIIGKEATQEEFFHTFNDLQGKSKQIIISSDKPPKEIETLEARLRSRFEWGILADIGAPDYETRMAILKEKEESRGHNIDPKVMEYIAANITSNIRELEGAFNMVMGMASIENLKDDDITLSLAEQALKDMISPNEDRTLTVDFIIDTVAEHFKIGRDDLLSGKRSSKIVLPRQIAMYLCRYNLDLSLQDIGAQMGNRDHSTVFHGVNKIEEQLSTSPQLRETLDVLKKKIYPG